VVRSRKDQGSAGKDDSKTMKEADESDSNGSFPGILLLDIINRKCWASGEEDKKEEQAVVKQVSTDTTAFHPI